MAYAKGTPEQRFWRKVDKCGPDECWPWTASLTRGGYGHIGVGGRMIRAHRFSYEVANGPIPDGMVIDHTCRNPICVNPAHLRACTQKQNLENEAGPYSNNRHSGVRGVYWSKGRWEAKMNHHGKTYRCGIFATIAEAEAAVIAKRLELFTHNDADRRLSA